jgi:hypothetical protein
LRRRRGEPWPLRDHFAMTAVYAAVVLIGTGIAGGLM